MVPNDSSMVTNDCQIVQKTASDIRLHPCDWEYKGLEANLFGRLLKPHNFALVTKVGFLVGNPILLILHCSHINNSLLAVVENEIFF